MNYRDEDDFVDTYPFVPYQFELFISAMRAPVEWCLPVKAL